MKSLANKKYNLCIAGIKIFKMLFACAKVEDVA